MPQIVVIDKIPIYIQKLTAAQAVATGVKGWDKVLAAPSCCGESHRLFLGWLEATAPADSERGSQKTPDRKDWSDIKTNYSSLLLCHYWRGWREEEMLRHSAVKPASGEVHT